MKKESIAFLTLSLGLVCIGIFMVYSASAIEAQPTGRLFKQLIDVSIGLTAMFIGINLDYHRLKEPWVWRALFAFVAVLLVFVLIPGIGVVRGGARRWIEIFGFSFQPSEFGKFAVILMLAVKLSMDPERVVRFWRGVVPPLILTGIIAALIVAEKDLGTPLVICATAFLMLVAAGARWRHLLPTLLPGFALVAALVITSPHRMRRIISFMDPWKYRDDESYQLIQSLAGFARGAAWGQGPGAGEQKLYYLPEAHTDFIFSVWGEEMGLTGSLLLVILFGALFLLGMRIAWRAPDLFGCLLAGGIVGIVAVQSAVNMAVTIGLLPTKGLPLPFISLGGTSLIVFMGMVGIVINIALQAERVPKRLASAPA